MKWLLLIPLILWLTWLDTFMFKRLMQARAPDLPRPSVSMGEETLRAMLQQAKNNLEWLNSKECKFALAMPFGAIMIYIRDHYFRRQPWPDKKIL
jgi:hypothetical protein